MEKPVFVSTLFSPTSATHIKFLLASVEGKVERKAW
jgi:hypothetical protein